MSIQDQVSEIISKQSIVPKKEIGREDKLSNLGIDSLKKVELIIALEREFSVRFDESDLNPNALAKVEDMIGLVEKTIRKQ